jgi:hypothetical protein
VFRSLVFGSSVVVAAAVIIGCDAPAKPGGVPSPAAPAPLPESEGAPGTELEPVSTPAPPPDGIPGSKSTEIQWRGPNRYDLKLGDLVVGAGLKVPGKPWAEDYAGPRARFESPAGSTREVRLEPGESKTELRRDGQSYHHEHAVAVEAPHRVICEFTLVSEDAALLDDLARECSELGIEFEPDPRARWEIELQPATVPMAARSKLNIVYRVTNEGTDPLNAKSYSLAWKVNDEGSMSLGMAFGNGGYERTWRQLPSGATIEDRREGVHIADAPGEYVITLHHLDREVARATLRVTP